MKLKLKCVYIYIYIYICMYVCIILLLFDDSGYIFLIYLNNISNLLLLLLYILRFTIGKHKFSSIFMVENIEL